MEITTSWQHSDRYVFDFKLCSTKNGWAQIDTSQDAHYYGNWANPDRLMIVTYAEGDVITTKCDSVKEFVDQIHKMKAWNEEWGHTFHGIDPGLEGVIEARFREMGLGDLLH